MGPLSIKWIAERAIQFHSLNSKMLKIEKCFISDDKIKLGVFNYEFSRVVIYFIEL